MHTWTTRQGYPYLVVIGEKWSENSVIITLEQNWFLADGSAVTEEEAKTAIWYVCVVPVSTIYLIILYLYYIVKYTV